MKFTSETGREGALKVAAGKRANPRPYGPQGTNSKKLKRLLPPMFEANKGLDPDDPKFNLAEHGMRMHARYILAMEQAADAAGAIGDLKTRADCLVKLLNFSTDIVKQQMRYQPRPQDVEEVYLDEEPVPELPAEPDYSNLSEQELEAIAAGRQPSRRVKG